MKTTSKLLILVITLLALATSAYAQSPREELQQMVEQLQKTPNDNALRERIIKLAPTLKPSPALPPEAERRMARGAAAFKGATSAAAYQDAVKEFEQATLAAPWYGDAYFNLGVVQDKAGNYEAALRSLKLAQLASHESKEIKALIYEVEYRHEKANSPEARAARVKEAEQHFIASLEGAKYDCGETRSEDDAQSWHIEITQGKFRGYYVTTWINPKLTPGVDYSSNVFVGFKGYWYGLDGDATRLVQGRVSQWSYQGQVTRVEINDDRLVVNQETKGLPHYVKTCRRR